MLWAALRCDELLLCHGLYSVEVQKLQLAIISVLCFTAVRLCNLCLIAHQIILIGSGRSIGIADRCLIANTIVRILHAVVLVVGDSGDLMQEVKFKGCGTEPVGRGNEIAGCIVAIRHLLSIIIVNGSY